VKGNRDFEIVTVGGRFIDLADDIDRIGKDARPSRRARATGTMTAIWLIIAQCRKVFDGDFATDSRARSSAIPPIGDRQEWLHVLMSISFETDGSEEGRQAMPTDWSRGSQWYDKDDYGGNREAWPTFHNSDDPNRRNLHRRVHHQTREGERMAAARI
jgi:hypothetical protein